MLSKVLGGILIFFVIVITIVGLVNIDEAVKIGVGLHPYDWTDKVRRVWRGRPLPS